MRSKATEGLLCTGPGWLCLAEHSSASGLGLPFTGCISPHGHGPMAALRLQDKRNCRDPAEIWMSGTQGVGSCIGRQFGEHLHSIWMVWLIQWSHMVDYWSHGSWEMPADWVLTSLGLSLIFRSFGEQEVHLWSPVRGTPPPSAAMQPGAAHTSPCQWCFLVSWQGAADGQKQPEKQSETGDTTTDTRDTYPSVPCGQEGWEAAGWLELPSSQRKPCR